MLHVAQVCCKMSRPPPIFPHDHLMIMFARLQFLLEFIPPALSLSLHPTVLSYFAYIVTACVRACLNACVYVYTPESPSRGAIIHIILIPESGGINNIKCACACVRACLYAFPNCFYCCAYIVIMHAHCALS